MESTSPHTGANPTDIAQHGFTLVELIVVMAIITILMSVAIPAFNDYRLRTLNAAATADIRTIEKDVIAFYSDSATYPPDLATVGRGGVKDPWGNPYQYLVINAPGDGRQDTVIGNLNSDFDLYSMGPNGVAPQSVNDPLSSDDILRANDGASVIRAGDFF